jgi:hypothetical protein
MKRIVILVAGLAGAAVISPASAFMFADGTTAQCVAGGRLVAEKVANWATPRSRIALRARHASAMAGKLRWNQERLKGLRRKSAISCFSYECAHARIPTENEREANCAGLKDMRAAGRAGPAFETRLRGNFTRGQCVLATTRSSVRTAARSRHRATKPPG